MISPDQHVSIIFVNKILLVIPMIILEHIIRTVNIRTVSYRQLYI